MTITHRQSPPPREIQSTSPKQIIIRPSTLGTAKNPVTIEDEAVSQPSTVSKKEAQKFTFARLRPKGGVDNYETEEDQKKFETGGYKRPLSKFQKECDAEFNPLLDKETLKAISESEPSRKKRKTDIATPSGENSQEDFPSIKLKKLDEASNHIILQRPLNYKDNKEKYDQEFPPLAPLFIDKNREPTDLRYIVFPIIRLKDEEIKKSPTQKNPKRYIGFVSYNFINYPEFREFNEKPDYLYVSRYLSDYSLESVESTRRIPFLTMLKIWITCQNKEREKQGISVIQSYNPETIIEDMKEIKSENIKIMQNVFKINKESNDEMIEKIIQYKWLDEKNHSIETLLEIFSKFDKEIQTKNLINQNKRLISQKRQTV